GLPDASALEPRSGVGGWRVTYLRTGTVGATTNDEDRDVGYVVNQLAKDPQLHARLREPGRDWLQDRGLKDPDLLRVAGGQPSAIRPPHVFEEHAKWALENEPWEAAHEWVPKYASLKDHTDFVREKFEEDVREGLMERMTLGERRDGEHRAIAAIAALAVIVEDEASGNKRVIRDATHGVRVNHPILCRDKLQGGLLMHMLSTFMSGNHNDLAGLGGCEKKQLLPGDPDSQTVYVNKIGPCASYWWTRIAACGLRATHHLLGEEFMLEMLLLLLPPALGHEGRLSSGMAEPRDGVPALPAWADWLVAWLRKWTGSQRIEAKARHSRDWERRFLGLLRTWACWAFGKGGAKKTIAALELLATLVNEALILKAMTTKYPSGLVLMELAEELAAKDFKHFDRPFRLDKLLDHWAKFFAEVSGKKRKELWEGAAIRAARWRQGFVVTVRLDVALHSASAVGASVIWTPAYSGFKKQCGSHSPPPRAFLGAVDESYEPIGQAEHEEAAYKSKAKKMLKSGASGVKNIKQLMPVLLVLSQIPGIEGLGLTARFYEYSLDDLAAILITCILGALVLGVVFGVPGGILLQEAGNISGRTRDVGVQASLGMARDEQRYHGRVR
ncbi:unnamed protein product, partial [Symbiodinium sp. KB8]